VEILGLFIPESFSSFGVNDMQLIHFVFFFFYWRYNPLWVLAFSVILLHISLSILRFLHPLIPNAWMSSSVVEERTKG